MGNILFNMNDTSALVYFPSIHEGCCVQSRRNNLLGNRLFLGIPTKTATVEVCSSNTPFEGAGAARTNESDKRQSMTSPNKNIFVRIWARLPIRQGKETTRIRDNFLSLGAMIWEAVFTTLIIRSM